MPDFLSVEQVAESLNISKALVYKLISEGGLLSIRFGRLLRVKQSDLKAYIEQQSAKRPGEGSPRTNP